MNINDITALIRALKTIFWEVQPENFPIVIHFNQGMEDPEFTITIERNETDTYTDGKGQKWKKVSSP